MDGSVGTLVGGLFHLSAGEHLYILVGQKGSDACTLKVCHPLMILTQEASMIKPSEQFTFRYCLN